MQWWILKNYFGIRRRRWNYKIHYLFKWNLIITLELSTNVYKLFLHAIKKHLAVFRLHLLSNICQLFNGFDKKDKQVDTIKATEKTGTIQQKDDESEVDFRRDFISLYQKPVFIDTTFVDDDKTYEVIFHHFSKMDKGLVVPAKYNFDTNKDFVTHNFVSDLPVLLNKDTLFKKHITKSTFHNLLDTLDIPLKRYATLLYPNLTIKKGCVEIHYSISIPVTDVGIGVDIRFDKKGNYVFEQ